MLKINVTIAQYRLSEALLNLFVLPKCRAVVDMKQGASIGGFNDTVKIAKMTKRCSTKALYSPTKSFMNLEESHFELSNRISGNHNAMKVFNINQVPMYTGSQNSTEWHFQGIKISNMAQR